MPGWVCCTNHANGGIHRTDDSGGTAGCNGDVAGENRRGEGIGTHDGTGGGDHSIHHIGRTDGDALQTPCRTGDPTTMTTRTLDLALLGPVTLTVAVPLGCRTVGQDHGMGGHCRTFRSTFGHMPPRENMPPRN